MFVCVYIYFVLLHIAFGSGIIFNEHVVWTLATFFLSRSCCSSVYLDDFGLYLRCTVHILLEIELELGGGLEGGETHNIHVGAILFVGWQIVRSSM